MPREAVHASYHYTICFALLTLLQSNIATPILYSRKLIFQRKPHFLKIKQDYNQTELIKCFLLKQSLFTFRIFLTV